MRLPLIASRLLLLCGLLGFAVAKAAGAARADPVADFYAGRTIVFLCGSGPGASYDTHTRLMARFLGRYIPGKPNVVVQTMTGAGSMTLANYLYNVAPKDDTAVGMFSRGLFLEALFEKPNVRFDPLRFSWIGSHGREVSVLVSGGKTRFKTVADIQREQMIVAASGPGADTHDFALILNNLIGARLKLISGFQAQAEAFLALERGEVDGNAGATIGTLMALKPSWLTQPGELNFIVQLATERHPTLLQGVPLVMVFARNDLDRDALALAFVRQKIAYGFTGPPGIPGDRLNALRKAFHEVVRDPEFLAEATRLNADIAPVSGEHIIEIIRQAFALPKEVIARAKSAMAQPAN